MGAHVLRSDRSSVNVYSVNNVGYTRSASIVCVGDGKSIPFGVANVCFSLSLSLSHPIAWMVCHCAR